MKKTTAIILALVMVLSLAACGGGDTTQTTPPADPTDSAPDENLADVGDIASPIDSTDELDFGGYTADKPLTIKLATMQANENSHLNTLAKAFKERVEAWTEGAVLIELYLGDMGTDREIVDQVIAGTMHMGVNNTAIMANYNKMFDVLDIGYLVRNYDDVYDVMASDVWADMLGEFSSTGATLLSLQCIGFRTISTTEASGQVKTLADIYNKVIRITEGAVFISDYNAWGASPVSMSASEIMPALQNGTIDGVDHVPVTLYTGSGQAEYIKYMTFANQAAHFNGLTINNALYESLTDDLREIIQRAAMEAAEFRTQALQGDNDVYIKKLGDEYGIEFYQPTDEEIAEFIDAVEPVYQAFVEGHEYGSYAAAIREICEGN